MAEGGRGDYGEGGQGNRPSRKVLDPARSPPAFGGLETTGATFPVEAQEDRIKNLPLVTQIGKEEQTPTGLTFICLRLKDHTFLERDLVVLEFNVTLTSLWVPFVIIMCGEETPGWRLTTTNMEDGRRGGRDKEGFDLMDTREETRILNTQPSAPVPDGHMLKRTSQLPYFLDDMSLRSI